MWAGAVIVGVINKVQRNRAVEVLRPAAAELGNVVIASGQVKQCEVTTGAAAKVTPDVGAALTVHPDLRVPVFVSLDAGGRFAVRVLPSALVVSWHSLCGAGRAPHCSARSVHARSDTRGSPDWRCLAWCCWLRAGTCYAVPVVLQAPPAATALHRTLRSCTRLRSWIS